MLFLYIWTKYIWTFFDFKFNQIKDVFFVVSFNNTNYVRDIKTKINYKKIFLDHLKDSDLL